MKDSNWIYVKDCAKFSMVFIIEIALIPIYELNEAYQRTINKTKIK
jgi:hypothetical protein